MVTVKIYIQIKNQVNGDVAIYYQIGIFPLIWKLFLNKQ